MGGNRSAVRRRLAVVVCAGLLVVIMAGCTRGTTTIPRRAGSVRISCPEEGKPAFVPGPGTTHVRFQVLRSNATVPLLVGMTERFFFLVWDGTKSTGPVEFEWGEYPNSWLNLYGYDSSNASNTTWAITALDRNGKDVGITCAP